MTERPPSRAEAAAHRIALSDAASRHESTRAQQLVDEFVREARARGHEPQPLMAQLLSGRTVRTDKRGWYLRKNQSLAIGEDGGYYVLTVPGGMVERLRGVKLQPTPPPLQVGRGGRDGETGDLREFLAMTLERLAQR
ncbi:hypothetical protein DT076_06295 [Desertihabitans brevis]|uniref:Uncharacterized protein n=1 Tax=Desertihabitans brevis TaxID=2268447 RepID=A0A367YX03_9ACTN|nr:hypothetical protein [Desertihabitans brevis]RCK70267.1 hypothetical protein DT076_06295 [Desertihabitans brevis]